MRRCRIWSCKLVVSCMLGIFAGFLMLLWRSDHMQLNIIYMIMHIHVEAGFRLLSPVQRKNVKASCPGMKIITKPSTKGIVLWGDQPSSEPMPWRAAIWRPRSLYRESQYWTEAPVLAKFGWIFVWYHRLYTSCKSPVNTIQSKYNTIPYRFGIFLCGLVKKGKLIKHMRGNPWQDVDMNLLDQPEVVQWNLTSLLRLTAY